jgi:hypothetical protein
MGWNAGKLTRVYPGMTGAQLTSYKIGDFRVMLPKEVNGWLRVRICDIPGGLQPNWPKERKLWAIPVCRFKGGKDVPLEVATVK